MRHWLVWCIAIILTLASVVYQRKTGPTYPMRIEYDAQDQHHKIKLDRTHSTTSDQLIRIPVPEGFRGEIVWKEHPSTLDWKRSPMQWDQGNLLGSIPKQPPAGKIRYYIEIRDSSSLIRLPQGHQDVITRFKGDVPAIVLIPHIIMMFAGMLISNKSGIEAYYNVRSFRSVTLLTLMFLSVGGLVFGCIVQYYAFGQPWTGWPVGTDLTDNKVAVAILAWLIPSIQFFRGRNPRLSVILASIVTLIIFLIPHSLLGSEFKYQ